MQLLVVRLLVLILYLPLPQSHRPLPLRAHLLRIPIKIRNSCATRLLVRDVPDRAARPAAGVLGGACPERLDLSELGASSAAAFVGNNNGCEVVTIRIILRGRPRPLAFLHLLRPLLNKVVHINSCTCSLIFICIFFLIHLVSHPRRLFLSYALAPLLGYGLVWVHIIDNKSI